MKKTLSQRNCRKKGKYPTEARARILGAYKAKPDFPLWPYVCPECGKWHLTKRRGEGAVQPPIVAGDSGIFGGAK